MAPSNSHNSNFIFTGLKVFLLVFVVVSIFSCKKKEENPKQHNEEEVVMPKLEKTCFVYHENKDLIKLEISKNDKTIEGNLTYAFEEKDKNTGTFKGELKGDSLIGIYTFQSEGVESKRQVAFLLKEDHLIEMYGEMNEEGTMFEDLNKLNLSTKTPLTQTDCQMLKDQCLFENGKSYSELKGKCVELTALEIKLNPLKDGALTEGESVYVLFNDDNTKAEIFLPQEDKGLMLTKINEGNWGNGNYKLISWKAYVLQKNGTAIFGGQ